MYMRMCMARSCTRCADNLLMAYGGDVVRTFLLVTVNHLQSPGTLASTTQLSPSWQELRKPSAMIRELSMQLLALLGPSPTHHGLPCRAETPPKNLRELSARPPRTPGQQPEGQLVQEAPPTAVFSNLPALFLSPSNNVPAQERQPQLCAPRHRGCQDRGRE